MLQVIEALQGFNQVLWGKHDIPSRCRGETTMTLDMSGQMMAGKAAFSLGFSGSLETWFPAD
jgi:hypothetical protein